MTPLFHFQCRINGTWTQSDLLSTSYGRIGFVMHKRGPITTAVYKCGAEQLAPYSVTPPLPYLLHLKSSS